MHPLEESAIAIAELYCELALTHAANAGDYDARVVFAGMQKDIGKICEILLTAGEDCVGQEGHSVSRRQRASFRKLSGK
jgi:hypothetical protein